MMEMEKSRRLEEASRAKVTAVEKYKAGDLAGAKEFALKANSLYPALPGLRRLISIADVLIVFGKTINGEVDWYAVLAVDPTADIGTIQSRCTKLYSDFVLDSDNSGISSVEANKILTAAWNYFCIENEKRKAYLQLQNLKRISNVSHDNNAWIGSEELSPNMVRSAMVEKARSVIKLILGMGSNKEAYEQVYKGRGEKKN